MDFCPLNRGAYNVLHYTVSVHRECLIVSEDLTVCITEYTYTKYYIPVWYYGKKFGEYLKICSFSGFTGFGFETFFLSENIVPSFK